MKDSAIITLKEQAVKNNIRFLRKKMGSKARISAVVKANAYGHGIEQMVPLFQMGGIDHFAVFDYSEAQRVDKSLSDPATIMIMGWLSDNNIPHAIQKGYEFLVFTIERLEKAIKYAKKSGIAAKIHIDVETGMNRTGLEKEAFTRAIELINENPDEVEICGFCTHLAGAESISNHLRIQKQVKRYNQLLKKFTDSGIDPKYRHIANSAAAFVYPKTRLDLVRIGIMLYGFWSSTETFIQYINSHKIKTDPLKIILGWQSKIMSLKHVRTGEFVSYGISYLAQYDMKIALVPVGYSNGYERSLSNKGRVLIHGQRCAVIGLVNMNMLIADVSNIDEVKIGDQVMIIGKQGDLEIKVSAFSDISEQLNYEVLVKLPAKTPRRIIQG